MISAPKGIDDGNDGSSTCHMVERSPPPYTYLWPLNGLVAIVDDAADQNLVLFGQLDEARTSFRAELNASHHRRSL